uniref:Uncharacterized protein n=1 Tax=Arundo donax TaxID=35708 RepID=A0A0A8ZI14_ARUDO
MGRLAEIWQIPDWTGYSSYLGSRLLLN